jgi:hypothetical protein
MNTKKEEHEEKKPVTKLSLKGKNLTNLDFLSKFLRENPQIENVDLGDNPLTDLELNRFSKNIA